METATFMGKVYTLRQLETVYFDDVVKINGVVGWLDGFNSSFLIVVTENEERHVIQYTDIKEKFLLRTGWDDPLGGRCPFSELMID